MFDPLSPRRRLLTFALALVLQRVLARISTARISTVRRATQPTSVAPALLPLAAAPRRLAPAGAPAIAASALATVLFLRLPAWAAARSGLVGLGLRAALLALTFDAWAAARTAATIADDLAAGDSVQARHRLQHLTADALPQDMSAQEIADRTAEALAAGAADRTVGPWLAYALFDLPGAVAYHLPVLLTSLWGQIPAVLMRAPVLNRAAGAGPRLALVRAIAARAAGLAYGAAAPAVGADPVPAIRASFAADQPAPAAAAAAINQTAAPAANQAAIDDAAMNQSAAPAANQAAIDDAAMNQSAAPAANQAAIDDAAINQSAAPAANQAAIDDAASAHATNGRADPHPPDGLRRAIRLHRAAMLLAALTTALLLLRPRPLRLRRSTPGPLDPA